jgi:hypothetical protein
LCSNLKKKKSIAYTGWPKKVWYLFEISITLDVIELAT